MILPIASIACRWTLKVNATKSLTPISELFDVMGMSHQSASTLATFHEVEPFKPLVMTECCSCATQRSEDADIIAPFIPSSNSPKQWINYSSEASACTVLVVRSHCDAST
jgi:hypothetical protein